MALTTTGREKLRIEVQTDPEGIVYSGTDQNVLNTLTALTRTRDRDNMTGDEVFQQTVAGEYAGITNTLKGHWLAFCGRETIDPFASANVQFVQDIFAPGTTTVANLQAARVESISRLTEIGIGVPTLHQIAIARS